MEKFDENISNEKIVFKPKRKNKCLRIKRSSDSDDDKDSDDMSSLLEDAKEIRKLRKRPNGVSAIGLALGKKLTTEEELIVSDPFKLKTGGFIDMKALKGKGKTGVEELDAVHLGSVFSAETNRRDEDADMMKYIDEELNKRKGISTAPTSTNMTSKIAENERAHESEESADSEGPLKDVDVLFEVPEHLRQATTKKSEEMLSNQMLSGIPEVDLGIEERIRNIEATEEAKLQVLRERMKKKEKSMSFVPTNMAVNFVQHNRFNVDETDNHKHKKMRKEAAPIDRHSPPKIIAPTGSGKGKQDDDEKATDDFHFEKFKKQFRRF